MSIIFLNSVFFFQIVNKNDWKQINDLEIIRKLCEETVEQNPKKVRQFKRGKKDKLISAIQQMTPNQKLNPAIMIMIMVLDYSIHI